MSIYINAATHISIQKPLTEDWLRNPILPNELFNQSIEPDYKQFLNPLQSRRFGKLLKRAIITAIVTLQQAELKNPEAIIMGTGLGCIENTEIFLKSLIQNDEQLLQPTYFMQSTHNTVSSQIALFLKCYGYNSTYSHRGTSFDSALIDAFMQMQLNQINNALIGAHDEMTIDYFNMLGKIGYWKNEKSEMQNLSSSKSKGSFSGECSVSLILDKEQKQTSICQIKAVELLYKPSIEELKNCVSNILKSNNLKLSDIDAIVTGINGDIDNDNIYHVFNSNICPDVCQIWYKHLFGESLSSSALASYIAAMFLKNNYIPDFMIYDKKENNEKCCNILIYNHFKNIDHSIILMSKIET